MSHADPRLPMTLPGETRDVAVSVRLSPEERRQIAEAARRDGMKPATWLRSLGLKHARGVLVVVLVLITSEAHGYSPQQYCTDSNRAERVLCHAEHAVALAECSLSLAADRWFGFDDALKDVATCRAEADAECRSCKAEVFCDTPTEVQP